MNYSKVIWYSKYILRDSAAVEPNKLYRWNNIDAGVNARRIRWVDAAAAIFSQKSVQNSTKSTWKTENARYLFA